MPQVSIQGGERVRIAGLNSTPQYNDYIATVVSMRENGRVAVEVLWSGTKKTLALKPTNIKMLDPEARSKVAKSVTAIIARLANNGKERALAAQQGLDHAAKLASLAGDEVASEVERSALSGRAARLKEQVEAGALAPEWPAEMVTELAILLDAVRAAQWKATPGSTIGAEAWKSASRTVDGLELVAGELQGGSAAPAAQIPAPAAGGIDAAQEQMIAELEEKKAAALAREDYEECGRLKQEIQTIRSLIDSGALSFTNQPPPVAKPEETPPPAVAPATPAEVPGPVPTLTGGERVRVLGLGKAPQYNEYVGRVGEVREDGRAVVGLVYNGEEKQLALSPKNLRLVDPDARSKLSGKVTDVVDSLSTGMHGRQRGTKQVQALPTRLSVTRRFAGLVPNERCRMIPCRRWRAAPASSSRCLRASPRSAQQWSNASSG